MMMPKRVAIVATNFPAYEQYCPNWVGMQDGLKRLEIEHRLFTCRPHFDVDDVVNYKPDLIIYGLLEMVRNSAWRHELRQRLPKTKIVLWYGDYRDRSTGQVAADLSELDMMFISNDAQSTFYEKGWRVKECHYLPLGSPIYPDVRDERFHFPFVFIGGTITGARFLERAKCMLRYKDEYALKIIDGPAHRPDIRTKVFRWMPTIYRSSDVCLDQSHFTSVLRYTSNRHWIITASGGFALTKRFPGCEEAYPEGTRVYFDSFEESIEKLRYYTEHANEREVIRLAGYEHAKQHTYDHRFRTMFQYLYG